MVHLLELLELVLGSWIAAGTAMAAAAVTVAVKTPAKVASINNFEENVFLIVTDKFLLR